MTTTAPGALDPLARAALAADRLLTPDERSEILGRHLPAVVSGQSRCEACGWPYALATYAQCPSVRYAQSGSLREALATPAAPRVRKPCVVCRVSVLILAEDAGPPVKCESCRAQPSLFDGWEVGG